MTATDAVKLFYDYVAIFFVVYLVGYSTFLLLAVAVGSSELYTRRRQEKLKNALQDRYYVPVSILVPAYNEEVTVAATVRSLLCLAYNTYETVSYTHLDVYKRQAQEFSDFEKALYSYDYDTDDYGFWHWVDVGSFVDYFILNEFTCNYDAGWLSTYVYKDIGGKYKMVIWDFNSSCDNYTESVTDPFRFELQDNTWYFMMTKDEYFIQRVLNRYAQLRATYLSDGYLEQYIDETLAYLGPAVERNFEKWGYTLSLIHI